jgi:DNA-binding PadR family transcriptional regulator
MREGNLRYAILGLVGADADGTYGYRLKGDLEALCSDFWQVNYGRLYRLLDNLEKAGDLEVFTQAQANRPNRKVYRITQRGRQSLDDWLLEPLADEPRPLRDELALKLLFLNQSNLETFCEQLKQQRSLYVGKLGRIARWRRRLRKGVIDGRITDLVMDAIEMRVKADLAWLDHISRKILRGVLDSQDLQKAP